MQILKVKEFLKERQPSQIKDGETLTTAINQAFIVHISIIKDCPIIYDPNHPACYDKMLRTKVNVEEKQDLLTKDSFDMTFSDIILGIYEELLENMKAHNANTVIFHSLLVTSPIYSPYEFTIRRGIIVRIKYI